MGVKLGQDYHNLEWGWSLLATRRKTRAVVVAAATNDATATSRACYIQYYVICNIFADHC